MMCHNPALDPSKLERRAARPSRFAGAFLGVFRAVLVQLRSDNKNLFTQPPRGDQIGSTTPQRAPALPTNLEGGGGGLA